MAHAAAFSGRLRESRELTSHAIELAAARDLKDVVAQTVATYLTVENDAMTTASGRIMSEYEQALEWTNTRFRGGLATIFDVQQAQTMEAGTSHSCLLLSEPCDLG